MKFISPGLLVSLGSHLIAGRDFSWPEVYGRRPVAMLSENLARELWGEPRRAIGKQINTSPKDAWREVIGVVQDLREDGVQEKAAQIAYYPLLMNDFEEVPSLSLAVRSVAYVVRTRRAGSQDLIEDVQRAVWSYNRSLPLDQVRTLDEIYNKSLARRHSPWFCWPLQAPWRWPSAWWEYTA